MRSWDGRGASRARVCLRPTSQPGTGWSNVQLPEEGRAGVLLLQVSGAQSLFGVLLGSWGEGGRGGGGRGRYRNFRMDLDRGVDKEKREGR